MSTGGLVRSPACVFKEGDEIGQFLVSELGVQTGRHRAHGALPQFGEIRSGDANLRVRAGGENDFLGGFTTQDTAVFLTIVRDRDPGFITADKARARIDNRLEQIAFSADGSDRSEIRSDGAAKIAEPMTGGTRGLRAV